MKHWSRWSKTLFPLFQVMCPGQQDSYRISKKLCVNASKRSDWNQLHSGQMLKGYKHINLSEMHICNVYSSSFTVELEFYLGHVLRVGDDKHPWWRFLIDGHDVPAETDRERGDKDEVPESTKLWQRWRVLQRYQSLASPQPCHKQFFMGTISLVKSSSNENF